MRILYGYMTLGLIGKPMVLLPCMQQCFDSTIDNISQAWFN